MHIFSRRFAEGTAADISRQTSATDAASRSAQRGVVATTAWILDQLAFGDSGNGAEGPLYSALGTDRSPLLARALASLNDTQRTLLQSRVPEASLQKLIALSRETNPRFFASGLLDWAAEHPDAAGLVCGLFTGPGEKPPGANEGLCRRAAAMLGQGPLTDQLPFLLKRTVRDSTSLESIVPMVLAPAVAGAVKLRALARFAGMTQAWYARGRAAKIAAGLLSYAAEIPAFSLSSRALSDAKYRPGLGEGLADATVILGALRLGGLLGNRAFAGLHAVNELGEVGRLRGWLGWTRPLLGQGSVFAGMFLGRKAEEQLHLREPRDNVTALVDTSVFMLSAGVGAYAGERVFLRGYARWQQEMTLRLELERRAFEHVHSFPAPSLFGPMWAAADAAKALGPSFSAERDFAHPMLLKSHGENGANDVLPISGEMLRAEYERISQQLDKISPHLESSQVKVHHETRSDIEERLKYWETQQGMAEGEVGEERSRFEQDIQIGRNLVLNRILNWGGEVLQDHYEVKDRPRLGLKSRLPAGSLPVLPEGAEPEAKPEPRGPILPSLVNHDIGYGKDLAVRDQQERAWRAIRGRMLQIREQLGESQGALLESLLSGTVVMPVGGGKTRTMIIALAAAIETGVFDAGRGDKFIILNHTDQIHGQNLKVAELLSKYFKKKTGRPLRVSEYKAENKDLSGDVVVVSIPSVNQEVRRADFQQELKEALGANGRLAVVAIDEVHHVELGQGKGKGTWKELLKTLCEISPHFFQLGFTATPTGKEPGRIFTISERELMQARVTPRTYLVKVEGTDLSQLKITSGGEFEARELKSTLLGHPERNERIYQSLEQHGLRQEGLSPSGKAQLEGVLGFAQDLDHAAMMAKGYAEYFGRDGKSSLHSRKLRVLGGSKGKISPQELEQALAARARREIDGIVAIVSGETRGQKDPILKAVERGEIEAVFTVDVFVEGADLYMFTHQLGGRPTFSRIKKGQERGRTNRRAPDEISERGELLRDRPKILFDVVDRYEGERALMQYGNLMGTIGHTSAKYGELFDAYAERVVDKVDRSGSGLPAEGEIKPKVRKQREAKASEEAAHWWEPLAVLLEDILHERYAGDLAAMALDLGENEGFVEDLLEGRGWEKNRWFLKRLATLLRQERGHFVARYNEGYGLGDKRVSTADVEILKGALAVYAGWEGKDPYGEGIAWEGEMGWGREETRIPTYSLARLTAGTVTDGVWRNLWRGLVGYFHLQAENTAHLPERRAEASRRLEALFGHFFAREDWNQEPQGAQETLLFTTRRLAALRYGVALPTYLGIEEIPPQKERTILTRWLNMPKGVDLEYSKNLTPELLYEQIGALLKKGFGVEAKKAEGLIEAVVFEERGWPRLTETSSAQEILLFTVRQLVARRYGGVLPFDLGIEEVPYQREGVPLTRWLNMPKGEKIEYSPQLTPESFYGQIRALLQKVFGVEAEKVDRLIEAAVFEERGWPKLTEIPTAQEILFFTVRQLVAHRYGGVLPHKLGIEGIAKQKKEAILTRWLNLRQGEKLFSTKFTPEALYGQIRALLKKVFGAEEVNRLIGAAVFEERGWPQLTETPSVQEILLFTVRQLVARRYGGVFPKDLGIEGIPPQIERAILTRWLKEEKKDIDDSLAQQILALLTNRGFRSTGDAEALIAKARHSAEAMGANSQ